MIHAVLLMFFSAFLGLSYTDAFALSSEEHRYFLQNSPAYADADRRLNEVWRELKGKLSKEDYSRLLAEQRQWLQKERDREAAQAKGNQSDAEAYAAVITARVDALSRRYNLRQSQQTPFTNSGGSQAAEVATEGQALSAPQGQQAPLAPTPLKPTASASPRQAAPAPPAGKTYTNSIGMEFVLIPAGAFVRKLEKPITNDFGEILYDSQKIIISKPFYLGKYEVTQEQWVAVMGSGSNPSAFKGRTNPVENFFFKDVKEFLGRLNAREAKKKSNRYRLPTEMEWLLAARGGTDTMFFFGDYPREEIVEMEEKIKPELVKISKTPACMAMEEARARLFMKGRISTDESVTAAIAECNRRIEEIRAPVTKIKDAFANMFYSYAWLGSNSDGSTHPVGQKKQNPYSLYDIYGNVNEVTSSPYEELPTDREIIDYVRPEDAPYYLVAYGFHWSTFWQNEREILGALRTSWGSSSRNTVTGLRLAFSPE